MARVKAKDRFTPEEVWSILTGELQSWMARY
jgi:hypothetical protein